MTEPELVNRVRLAVLERTAGTGRVPSASEVAALASIDEAAVIDAFRALHDGHVYVLEPGDPTRLRMANPFSGVPTGFKVEVGGRHYFGNCVWDALGVVSMLGGDGMVTTSCPDCREPLALKIAGNQPVTGDGVVHFGVPARRWWDDIVFT